MSACRTRSRRSTNGSEGRTAAARLAALARSLLQPGDEAGARAIDAADRALHAVPEPPRSVPATAEAQAAAWRDLAKFRAAATEVGHAAAGILNRALAGWRERYQALLEQGRHIRAALPRLLPPDLADPLRALDEAERALPRPPGTLSATAAGVLDDLRPIADGLDLLPGVAALQRAQEDLLTGARGRLGRASRPAPGSSPRRPGISSRTPVPRPRSTRRRWTTPGPPCPRPRPVADDTALALNPRCGRWPRSRPRPGAVLRDATSGRGLQEEVARAAQTEQAARNLLPLTGDQRARPHRASGHGGA